MKVEIKSFKKEKNGMYKLVLENQKDMLINEDLIIKYNLLTNKKISDSLREQIIAENKKYEVYSIALKYINTRLRSKKEIVSYLSKKGIDLLLIEEVVQLLEHQHYISDDVYTTAFVNDQINLTKNGPLKIIRELKARGIKENILENKMNLFNESLIQERIKYLIDRKIKTNKNKGSYLLKQKILDDLINIGYTKEDIINILNETDIEDNQDMAKREYDKLYKKLAKKYEGPELEYQIRKRLYQKGFIR